MNNLTSIVDIERCHIYCSQTPKYAGTFDLRSTHVRKLWQLQADIADSLR